MSFRRQTINGNLTEREVLSENYMQVEQSLLIPISFYMSGCVIIIHRTIFIDVFKFDGRMS